MLKKYYLGIFFLAPIPYKWYPNTSEFASDPPSTIVSAYDSHSIQPLVETFPSYIRNRKPFLQLLESLTPFPDTTIMVTTNATSLCIKMLHEEDIKSVLYYIKLQHETLSKGAPSHHKIDILSKITLMNINLSFMDRNFVLLVNTAMGTKATPPYANLFMCHLKKPSKYQSQNSL